MLTDLGLGIRILSDNAGSPGATLGDNEEIAVGDFFWVEVLAEDISAAPRVPQGVVSLPLNLSWDSADIRLVSDVSTTTALLLTDVLVTPRFPLQRSVDSFDQDTNPNGHLGFVESSTATVDVPTAPTLEDLRGGALPAIGSGQEIGVASAIPADDDFVFSQLRFQAISGVVDTPFTMELAGSMSFADADALEDVVVVSAGVRSLSNDHRNTSRTPVVHEENGDLGPAITEFITVMEAPEIPPGLSSLSGFVYADTNQDGVFDANEIGLPNVEVILSGAAQGTVITGPNGFYLFENLGGGVYNLAETQPAGFVDASVSVGQILPADEARGTVPAGQFNLIQTIQLADTGEQGVNYNFGDNLIASKRNFLSSTNVRESFCEGVGLECDTIEGTADDNNIVVENIGNELTVTVDALPAQNVDLAEVDIVFIDSGAGQDTVTVAGSSGDDTALSTPRFTTIRQGDDYTGSNFGVVVINSEQTTVTGGDSGDDRAVLIDSTQDDQLEVGGDTATLDYVGIAQFARAMGFDRVQAMSFNGGADTEEDVAAIDFVLELVGDWQSVP